MSSLVEELIVAQPAEQIVLATTKREVFATLDAIRSTVEKMEEFTQFPEGSRGAILYALLKDASKSCPDVGDFNYIHQGCQAVLSAAFKVLSKQTFDLKQP
jgi:hypothetical protein